MSKIIDLSTYYYLKSEIDTLLNGKANSVHTHDDRYYTETEVDTKLSGKSDTSHKHDDRYLQSVLSHTDSNGAYGKATTAVWGHTKLSSAINSTDETIAATPKAVKTAYDLANSKANASHTHDDTYYTETEINEVFDELNDVDVFAGANKSIAQTGDTIYLTGTLFGDDIEGKTIQFYNGNTLLGSSITNAYGSAVYQYNCTGVGKKEITTKYGSVVSETLPVWDTLFYETGATSLDITTKWTKGSALTVEINEDEYTTVSSTNSNSSNGKLVCNTDLTGDFEVSVKSKATRNGNTILAIGVNSATVNIRNLSSWVDVRFRRENGVYSAEYKLENESTWTDLTVEGNQSSGTEKFMFYIYNASGNTNSLDFKDLKVYLI